jgi:hypothetical protein
MGRVNAGYGLCSSRTVKCEQRVGAPAALTLLRLMHVTLHQRRRLRYVEKDQPLESVEREWCSDELLQLKHLGHTAECHMK